MRGWFVVQEERERERERDNTIKRELFPLFYKLTNHRVHALLLTIFQACESIIITLATTIDKYLTCMRHSIVVESRLVSSAWSTNSRQMTGCIVCKSIPKESTQTANVGVGLFTTPLTAQQHSKSAVAVYNVSDSLCY